MSQLSPLYPVDLHSHTIASSHAYSTLHDYIAEARRKGIKMFANTDHGPGLEDGAHYWHFVNLKVIPRLVEGVGILRGIEANILNTQGETDCYGATRDWLDIVLAGFHRPLIQPTTVADHTEALINTMRSGKVDVITHPGNPAFPIDVEAVVQAAVEYNVALEVNNSSFTVSRVGCEANCTAIVEAACKLGAKISVGSDAHIAFDLGNFAKAHELVQAANFPAERIINSSPRRLLDFLVSRGYAPIPEFADL